MTLCFNPDILSIRRETVQYGKEQDKTVFFVDENALIACFDTSVTEVRSI